MRNLMPLIVAAFATLSSFGAFNCEVVVSAGDLGESRTAVVTYYNNGTSAIDNEVVK